jgi:hypothetical protein
MDAWMKITNYKIQITNKFQITMPKITNKAAPFGQIINAWMHDCMDA